MSVPGECTAGSFDRLCCSSQDALRLGRRDWSGVVLGLVLEREDSPEVLSASLAFRSGRSDMFDCAGMVAFPSTLEACRRHRVRGGNGGMDGVADGGEPIASGDGVVGRVEVLVGLAQEGDGVGRGGGDCLGGPAIRHAGAWG